MKTDGKKEAKEGPVYQSTSNIGLNLAPNKTDNVANEIDVNIEVTKEELQNFEKFLPELTVRPVAAKHPFSRNNVYNFIIFIINIKLQVPRRSFGNMAKSTFSAFTTDNGFNFQLTLLLNLRILGAKFTKPRSIRCLSVPMIP